MTKIAPALMFKHIASKKPTYASPEEVMEAHGKETWADVKYDGYRVQVHKSEGGNVRIFTNNGNQLNYQCYPDVMEIVARLPECIIEAELIAPGATHKEQYENTKRRFRNPGIKQETVDSYLASGIVKELPLSLKVFDTLRWGRKTVMRESLRSRRQYTERLDGKRISPSETQVVRSSGELEALVKETINGNGEGRVCKAPWSTYQPGSKTIDWVKFKRSESLDLVVVGFYKSENFGEDLPFTGVLCATYNEKTGLYETIGKIGTTREGIADEIQGLVQGYTTDVRPANVEFSERLQMKTYAQHEPAWYIDPEHSVVLEVKAMNLNRTKNWQTCGLESADGSDGKAYSMRIGFVNQLRHDKDPRQATTTQAVAKLYELQELTGGNEGGDE